MNETPGSEGRISALMGQYAVQMRPWVRLMSWLTFIGAGFMFLVGLAVVLMGVLAGGQAATGEYPFGGAIAGTAIGCLYALMGLIYLPPAVFLRRSANAIKRMASGDQTAAFEGLLKNQKSFWRFVGILSLICIVLMVIVFIVGIGAGALWYARGH